LRQQFYPCNMQHPFGFMHSALQMLLLLFIFNCYYYFFRSMAQSLETTVADQSCGKVLKNETAFPFCRATDCLWHRKTFPAVWLSAPCLVAVKFKWNSAKVSGTVTSHAIDFLLAQSIKVSPSGHLPPPLRRPTGSLTVQMCALLTAVHMMSFIWLCLCYLGVLPCKPCVSTVFPHT